MLIHFRKVSKRTPLPIKCENYPHRLAWQNSYLRFMTRGHFGWVWLCIGLAMHTAVAGQNPLEDIGEDSEPQYAYVESFDNYLIGRTYLSRKYNNVEFNDQDSDYRLRYLPNSSLNLGVGATYKLFTLNIGVGLPFLNPDRGRGDSQWLDLQSHIYSRKFTVDFYGQFYNGYYLDNTATVLPNFSERYYRRQDARSRLFGLSGTYIFNHEKFSYRAALVHNEWQKRSAGSWLVGFDVYGGSMRADSSLVPVGLIDSTFYNARGMEGFGFFRLGPSIGYAHTFVVQGHWFAMLSGNLNLSLTFSSEDRTRVNQSGASLNPAILFRGVAGYNSKRWFAALSIVQNSLRFTGITAGEDYLMQAGNFRLNIARRFLPNPKTKRVLDRIEEPINGN